MQILAFDSESANQNAELVALFNRTDEYAEAIERLETLEAELAKLAEPEARQRLAGIAREVVAITTRDFFPGRDDDELLKAMTPVLDSLYAGYASAESKD